MRILVATDGSKPVIHADKHVINPFWSQSSKSNSVTLISVHGDVGLRQAVSFAGNNAVADDLRELSEKELKSARKLLDSVGVKHDIMICTGRVAKEIVGCAKAGKYDVIALGAKGSGAIADLLFGSVAQRFLAMAEMPVVLVK